jgi:hypothetical protein
MTGVWNELVARVLEVVAPGTLILLMLGVATLVAALWFWYPKWIPRRWPRLPRLRWSGWRVRWPRVAWLRWRWSWLSRLRLRWRRTKKANVPAPESAEEVPELPATDYVSLADRLAAGGRFAEAVRERLRGMVRELIERGVLEHRPGWTVTELAATASQRRPPVADPLREAAQIFSDLWYGQRPARAEHDARMTELAAMLRAKLAQPPADLKPPPDLTSVGAQQ